MLSYNEILPKKYIVLDNEPYEVLSSHTMKKNRQKPSNQTKLKSLRTGKVVEKAFHQSDSVEEADIEKKSVQYLYSNKGEHWFCEEDNPKDRFSLDELLLGDSTKFLKEKSIVDVLVFNDEIICISLPVKMDFLVVEAPPNIKGNTAQGGVKPVTIESGATVTTPMFIETGDVIRVNTETGEYAERVEKA